MNFGLDDIRGLVYEDEKLYMISTYAKGIVIYDFKTGKMETMGYFPQDVRAMAAFERMIKCGSKIYLFPCLEDRIYCYDLQTREYTRLFTLHDLGVRVPGRIFFDVLEYEGFVYAVCRFPAVVIRIDPQTDAITAWQIKTDMAVDTDRLQQVFSVCVHDRKLIYPYAGNTEIAFSIDDYSYRIRHLAADGAGNGEAECRGLYGMAVNSRGERWGYNLYGDLYRIIGDKMTAVEMPEPFSGVYHDGEYDGQPAIGSSIFVNDKLYFLMGSCHKILMYDTCANTFTWHACASDTWNHNRRKIAFNISIRRDDSSFLLYSYHDETFYVWDTEKGFTGKTELMLPFDRIMDDEPLQEYALYRFLHCDNLNAYLSYIRYVRHNETETEKKSCGTEIYHQIAGEINRVQ